MTAPRYAAVAAFVALAMSGCAQESQTTGGQPPASIAAATGPSRPSSALSVNTVATPPAPPPRTALATAPPPTASTTPAATSPPEPTVATQSGLPGGDQSGPRGQLYSKHAAQLRLDADVATLTMPPGAIRQTSPIPAAVAKVSGYMAGETAALDTWWSVPGTRADVQAYVSEHPPRGFSAQLSTPNIHGESVLSLSYPQDAKEPSTFFEVGIAQDGDHVDLRVQLQVGYLPTRTAVETIPASVTSGTGVYQPPNQMLPNNATPAPRRQATLSSADVRLLAGALNGLDAESQIDHSCPAPDGEEAWFTFVYDGNTVVFHAELNGCGGVDVTSDGVPQPELGLSDVLFNAVRQALHVTKAENPLQP